MIGNYFTKDPDALKDFSIDWDQWLPAEDTIVNSNWYVTGLTIDLTERTDRRTVVWLAGGTANTEYAVTNRIETEEGRTEDQTIYILVVPS